MPEMELVAVEVDEVVSVEPERTTVGFELKFNVQLIRQDYWAFLTREEENMTMIKFLSSETQKERTFYSQNPGIGNKPSSNFTIQN